MAKKKDFSIEDILNQYPQKNEDEIQTGKEIVKPMVNRDISPLDPIGQNTFDLTALLGTSTIKKQELKQPTNTPSVATKIEPASNNPIISNFDLTGLLDTTAQKQKNEQAAVISVKKQSDNLQRTPESPMIAEANNDMGYSQKFNTADVEVQKIKNKSTTEHSINIVLGENTNRLTPPNSKSLNKRDAFDDLESLVKNENARNSSFRKKKKKKKKAKSSTSPTNKTTTPKQPQQQAPRQPQKKQPYQIPPSFEGNNPHQHPKRETRHNNEIQSMMNASNTANQTGRLSFQEKVPVKPQFNSNSGNTEIIDGLMRLRKERVNKTSAINMISRKNIADINLNLDDKILPNTEQLMLDKNIIEMQKLKELKERRNQKISDFVFVGDSDNSNEDETLKNQHRQIEDFENFEDAPAIMSDIIQLKGSLIVRLLFLILTGLISAYITLANDYGLPMIPVIIKETSATTYLFVQIILGLISAFVSYTVISCGLNKLFTFNSDCDSISALAITTSLISAMLCLASPASVQQNIVHIFIPIAIFSLIFNTIGKILIVNRTTRNFKYVSGDFERYAVFAIDDEERAGQFTRGTLTDFPILGSMRKTEFLTEFLKNSYSADITDKFCKVATPLILLAAVTLGVIMYVTCKEIYMSHLVYASVGAISACIAVCSCFAMMLVVNLPMSRATKKHLENSAMMLSYQSVEDFSDTNSILVDVAQLFPQGMIVLSAIKIFSDTRIDEAIIEAASLTNHAGSILKHMFYDIIAGKTEMLNPVESYIYEDSLGLCGWINNKRIILGNRQLMKNHSINGLPTEEREIEYTGKGKSAIYLSISGELSAMFIIEIKASLEVQRWLNEIEKNNIYIILRSVDAIVSITKISEMFDISPGMLKLVPFRLHNAYEAETSYIARQPASLACSGRFQSFASLVIGSKRVRKVATLGICIQTASIILGFVIALVLILMYNFTELSASIALIYNLAFAIFTLIIQGVKKI